MQRHLCCYLRKYRIILLNGLTQFSEKILMTKKLKVTLLFKKYALYFKNASLYFLVTIITSLIGLVVFPFMAKNMSPEDYNITGYFTSFNLLLLPLLNFSLITYYTRNYFKFSEERRIVVADTLLKALLMLGAVLIPLVTLGFTIFFKLTNVALPIFPFFLFAVISTFFNNFLTLLQVKYRMQRKANKYFKLTLTSTLISTSLTLLMVVGLKWGAFGAMFSPAIVAVLIAIYSFRKMYNHNKFERSIVKDAFHFGWPLSVSAMLWYFVSGIDKAFLEQLNDIDNFALYNIGGSVASRLGIIYVALAQTFDPDIYKAIADNKLKKVVQIIGGIVGTVVVANIVFILLSKPLMKLLTADRYTMSYMYANVLSLRNVTTALYYSTIAIIVGYGFTKYDLVIRIIGAGFSVLIYKVLIDKFQFIGAAWAQVFSFFILAIISAFVIIFILKPKISNNGK